MITFLYLMLCFMLPNIVWQILNRKKLAGKRSSVRHLVWTYIYWIYCALVIHVTGIGTLWDILSYGEVVGGINFIPFSSSGSMTYILNVVMLMPFGFLLPFIWKEFRSFGKVCLSGFGFSLLIEVFQLFNLRLSDVDDLTMNTIGACAGYLLWILYSSLFRGGKPLKKGKRITGFSKAEPMVYVVLGLLGVFFLFNWRPLDAAMAAKNMERNKQTVVSSPADSAALTSEATANPSVNPDRVTVVCADGAVEQWTYNELLFTYQDAPEQFLQRYVGAKVFFTDTAVLSGLNSFGDTGKMYRSLTFNQGWRVEFEYEGYEFIDEADKAGKKLRLSVESFIADVREYEKGKFQIVLGSWDETDAGKTVIKEAE